MKHQIKRHLFIFSITSVSALLLHAMFPVNVLADDEPPVTPDGQTVLVEPVDGGDIPQTEPLLENLPEDASVVVLNINDEIEPLATQTAATVIANSDPFWCPTGTDPVGGGCTSYATFTDLKVGLAGLASLTDGTIYIQQGVYGGPESNIELDGNVFNNVGNLTMIGGWDLTTLPPTPATSLTYTTFSVPVSISNWTHNVTVKNIIINGTTTTGLTIETSGQATVDNVMAINNAQDGIYVDAGDTVTLKNIQANSNGDDGIEVLSNTNAGSLNFESIHASHNGDDGIRVYSKAKSNITINNMTTINNGGDGLDYESPKDTTGVSCNFIETYIPAGVSDAFTNQFIQGPFYGVERQCYASINQLFSIQNITSNDNGANGLKINTTGHFMLGFNPSGPTVLTTFDTTGNGGKDIYLNVFTNRPSFPWAYYQAIAKSYGVSLTALDNVTEETQIFFRDLNSNDFAGLNNVFYNTDALGSVCQGYDLGGGGVSQSCASPPFFVPILGGETISLAASNSTSSKANNSASPLCSVNSIAVLELPNKDSVTIFCPINGEVAVKTLTKKGLPGPAPDGAMLVSGVDIKLTNNGAPVTTITDNGHLKVSFAIPANTTGKNFTILYWDDISKKWIELPPFSENGGKAVITDLGNGRQVLEGTKVLSDIGLVEASVNFPGIFILVVK